MNLYVSCQMCDSTLPFSSVQFISDSVTIIFVFIVIIVIINTKTEIISLFDARLFGMFYFIMIVCAVAFAVNVVNGHVVVLEVGLYLKVI